MASMDPVVSKSPLICIDAGHGGYDPGCVYGGLQEKAINLLICHGVEEVLWKLNSLYVVTMTRASDRFVSLAFRSELANRLKADVFVSIHTNADPDPDLPDMPEAQGEEIWISSRNEGSKILAKGLVTYVDLIFSREPFRGIKTSDHLYVLNHVDMPACLIEVGFIDKSSSLESFSNMSTLRKISDLIARGIDQYFVRKKGGD